MKARAVIGANYGDEGKGLVTDFLCVTQGSGTVVRFNGGAQAGHTVVTTDGIRHVFHHFGSGTFANVPTYLSEFFICNPIICLREAKDIFRAGFIPKLFAHPSCKITTFADMVINQRLEDQKGDKRHGSCGLGIAETINRSKITELAITMADLWNRSPLEDKLKKICDKYARFRGVKAIEKPENMIAQFIKECEIFANSVHPAGIAQCKEPIFEGAQGLMLCQSRKDLFPHVTRSYTGMRNVRELCEKVGINDIEVYYVSRTYLTRHGAGPLPGEDKKMKYEDLTNTDHPYQGRLRFAPLNELDLRKRIHKDMNGEPCKIVLTHCDQLKPTFKTDLYSWGPTGADVEA